MSVVAISNTYYLSRNLEVKYNIFVIVDLRESSKYHFSAADKKNITFFVTALTFDTAILKSVT